MVLELTARCNNACSHCYINLPEDDVEAMKSELSFEEIKKIVDEAVSLGALWFLISGGEPLLRKDFSDIYMYLKKKGALITIYTNAALITNEHIKLFKKYPPRGIEVSVYGVSKKVHALVTRRNHFDKTCEGIEKLLTAGLPVRLKATILRSNHKELQKIARWCQEKSKSSFRFSPFLHLRLDRNPQKNRQIISERLTFKEIIDLEKNDPVRLKALEKKCQRLDGATQENKDRIFKCNAGVNECCVGYDGTFKLCTSLVNGGCTYDLRKGTLSEAWNIFTPKVISMKTDKQEFKETCGKCSFTSLCMWCPAHADLETGKLDGHINYFCDMTLKRYHEYRKDPPQK